MDEEEQTRRFSSNLMMPGVDIDIWKLPHGFVLRFILHPFATEDKGCEIMARVEKSVRYERNNEVASSHTLALNTYGSYIIRKTIEVDCIAFLFTKLFLPNVSYHWGLWSRIELLHLNIKIYAVQQLPEAFTDEAFYSKYRLWLDVDLEEGHSEK